VIDADQLLVGDCAVEEGDSAGVAGHHLAVGDEPTGQSVVDGAEVLQRLPGGGGCNVPGDFSDDGGHSSFLRSLSGVSPFNLHPPLTGESSSFPELLAADR